MRSQFGPTLPLLILDAAGSFAITIPLVGVLVRYRAHYSPKAVQLESEDGVQLEARTGPVIDGYFSTLKRVYKFEGWAGFYKGAVPELLTGGLLLVLLTIVPILLYGTDSPGTWPDKAKLEALGCATLLISLPITVLTYRIIVTPHKLSWLGLRQSLCTVLTPTERTRPWMLYQTPGLLVAQLLNAVVTPSLMVFQRFVLPDIPRSRGEIDFRFILQFSVYVILIILETSIVVPLQIISTRLALQRNHASQTHSQDGTNGIESVLPVYSAEEDVIGLRDENDPYTSFFDCLKRMISEEGVATLFRAWWITFIPVFAAGILDAGKKPNFHT
ncbi:hypothetical protein J132_02027 [Termitomyces sp. J132]|nr:hypothetical protein J132_02027 [Termitomyces sp. J132]